MKQKEYGIIIDKITNGVEFVDITYLPVHRVMEKLKQRLKERSEKR